MIFFDNISINGITADGTKTGFWKIYDLKRNIVASGTVKDNSQFDEVNYFLDGKIFATQKQDSIIIFYKDKQRIHTRFSRKNRNAPIVNENGEPIDEETKMKYYQCAELPVMFYGGSPAIAQYIKNNIGKAYAGKRGRLTLEIVIDIDGKIEAANVVKSDNPSLNSEAIRLIKNMPRWQPGMQQGHFVRTRMQIPLTF